MNRRHAKKIVHSILELNKIRQIQRANALVGAFFDHDSLISSLFHVNPLLSEQVRFVTIRNLVGKVLVAGLDEVFVSVSVRYGKKQGAPLTFILSDETRSREMEVEVARTHAHAARVEGDVGHELRRAVVDACADMAVCVFRRERMYRSVIESETEVTGRCDKGLLELRFLVK